MFFLEKETYLLKGYQFFLNDNSSDGEFIHLEKFKKCTRYIIFDGETLTLE